MKKLILILILCCFIVGCKKDHFVDTGLIMVDESLLPDHVTMKGETNDH